MREGTKKLAGAAGVISGIGAISVSTLWPEKPLGVVVLSGISSTLLLWFFISYFEVFRAYSKKRSTHLRLNSVLMVCLVLFIIVVLNLIVYQYYLRFDFTSTRKFSLSASTLTVLKNIKTPLRVLFLGSENARQYERMEYLLDAYRYHNKNILYELHDLDRAPLLAKRYGVREYNTVVVERGDKFFKDRGSDEQTVTNLLIRATRKRNPVIRFLQGHEEHPLNEERSGYSRIVEILRKSGFRVEGLYLTESGAVPSDTDVLVIASPSKDLRNDETMAIREYMMEGGKLILLLNGPKQATSLLKWFYLRLSEYPVYDEQNVAGIGPSAPLVKEYPNVSLTRDLYQSTFFPSAHEVLFYGPIDKYTFKGFVKTTKYSWYEKNGDGKKQQDEDAGYQSLGAYLVPEEEMWRVVLFGDSDFVSNAYVELGGNGEMFLRALNWITGEGLLVSIVKKPGAVIPLFITQQQLRIIRLLGPIAIPTVIVLTGFIVWLWRRRL
jgi:ABC-type uncharacterized transport system involved in gliding motility auxiliary subunit